MMMNQEVKDALAAVSDLHGGRFGPDEVIAAARSPESPLHSLFDWDVEQAALAHWRDRAREIIRSVRVDVRTERTVVRTVAYVRDPECPPSQQGYRALSSIRSDSDLAREVCAAEFSRASAALTRAKNIASVLGVEDEIDVAIAGLTSLRRRVSEILSA